MTGRVAGPAGGGDLGHRRDRRGIVFVLSAPSGTGKTTVTRRLLDRVPGIRFSVSCTTRSPRPGERNGVDYHFMPRTRFDQLRRRGEFLESAEVDGAAYGTSRRRLEGPLKRGEDMLLDIDTQGAAQVRRRVPGAVLIFLLPPGPGALRRRLRRRGTDPMVLERRLRLARREITRCGKYDYLVLNDHLEEACRDLEAIIRAERSRTPRQRGGATAIQQAFRAEARGARPGSRRTAP